MRRTRPGFLRAVATTLALAALVLAGCVEPDVVGTQKLRAAVAAAPTPELAPSVNTTTTSGHLGVAWGTGECTHHYNGGPNSVPLDPRQPGFQGHVIEVSWSPELPTTTELTLRVVIPGTCQPVVVPRDKPVLASITGPSPLHLALPVEKFQPRSADWWVAVAPGGDTPGVAVEQEFTLHITSFVNTPFDAEHRTTGEKTTESSGSAVGYSASQPGPATHETRAREADTSQGTMQR